MDYERISASASQCAKGGGREPACGQRAQAALPSVVSLFCGAGGLDLGFMQEGFKIRAAFDISPAAIRTHRRNFAGAAGHVADLVALGPAGVQRRILETIPPGTRIGIIGGPPCQGFSRANVNASSSDPRNELPNLYLKIIRRLQQSHSVEFVVFENVLGIRDAKHAEKYKALVRGLRRLNLHVAEQTLCALDFGVPQLRKRIVLAAMAKGAALPDLQPRRRPGLKSVREAIGGLEEPAFFVKDIDREAIPEHPNHWTMNPRSARFRGHKAGRPARSFKQLSWDRPSPTIAFGNREIHVHPNGRRRLSIFEAMLLQGFPRTFVLEGNLSEQVQQVSNAVPPPLARSIASAFRRALASGVRL
ncbi:MAG TPA: DNA cytosine methyltransferase [Acidobacteriaceae bacterium]|nr:DNA cytosine methyltransferase [Acidobacteriaceae bacterium]